MDLQFQVVKNDAEEGLVQTDFVSIGHSANKDKT